MEESRSNYGLLITKGIFRIPLHTPELTPFILILQVEASELESPHVIDQKVQKMLKLLAEDSTGGFF